MKNTRKGTWLIYTGILLIAAALIVQIVSHQNDAIKTAWARQTVSVMESSNKGQLSDTPYMGVLRIPALDLQLPVFSTYSQRAMEQAPCLYMNDSGHMILCAHNADCHFGRIDTSRFRYEYRVVQPDEVERMTDTSYALTLFTCTPYGQARITVRACMCQSSERI
ncbi:sortase [uncultured Dubosiella sp.]|jgi:sortase (surface protein transpeptidase)|uniref:sortase n=2 Tax=uncultured Dubosiella sp. TaxID=1937011 RepID=UPI00208436CE|nr:sortase [uncultured Dubosiella sp.]GJM57765.1 hypothetical protein EROP_14580 [Erysipelotrichaceae bacterium OPF54]